MTIFPNLVGFIKLANLLINWKLTYITFSRCCMIWVCLFTTVGGILAYESCYYVWVLTAGVYWWSPIAWVRIGPFTLVDHFHLPPNVQFFPSSKQLFIGLKYKHLLQDRFHWKVPWKATSNARWTEGWTWVSTFL